MMQSDRIPGNKWYLFLHWSLFLLNFILCVHNLWPLTPAQHCLETLDSVRARAHVRTCVLLTPKKKYSNQSVNTTRRGLFTENSLTAGGREQLIWLYHTPSFTNIGKDWQEIKLTFDKKQNNRQLCSTPFVFLLWIC